MNSLRDYFDAHTEIFFRVCLTVGIIVLATLFVFTSEDNDSSMGKTVNTLVATTSTSVATTTSTTVPETTTTTPPPTTTTATTVVEAVPETVPTIPPTTTTIPETTTTTVADVGVSGSTRGVWDRLAECETGGNWSHPPVSGGFSGGIMFHIDTWVAMGGTRYASQPYLASKGQQIAVAENLLAEVGSFQPWPGCRRKLGLR